MGNCTHQRRVDPTIEFQPEWGSANMSGVARHGRAGPGREEKGMADMTPQQSAMRPAFGARRSVRLGAGNAGRARPPSPGLVSAIILMMVMLGQLLPAATAAASSRTAGTAPPIAAASNFGQAWRPGLLEAAAALPVRDLRDAVYWDDVERSGGRYVFDNNRSLYPDRLPTHDMAMSLTVNSGHFAYDGGVTPHTPEGVAAFARFAAFAVARFPAIHSVEVGNEMNSDGFVSGPMETSDLDARAAYYVAMLRATWQMVKATDPDTQVLGGAAHSIPIAWITALLDHGAAAYMDALVIHPYTTAPEHLARQIALLRDRTALGDMPLEVTEFGHEDPAVAPAYMMKHYCQMALSGVRRVVWYPLNVRGDGFVPLIDERGDITDAGRAYRLIQAQLVNRPVTDVAPDPFTYACQFGPHRLMIWGEPRSLQLSDPALAALGPTGTKLDPAALRLSMTTPILIVSDGPAVALGQTVRLGPQRVIADSTHQFHYPAPGLMRAPRDPFLRFGQHRGEVFAFETRPGQEKGGVPWTPYLGSKQDGLLRLGPDWLVPSAWPGGPIDVVHRYTAQHSGAVDLDVRVDPGDDSVDGVIVDLLVNGTLLERRAVAGAEIIAHPRLSLAAGDQIDVVVRPGETATGDSAKFRITVRHPDP